jgi:serine O-acetyltransferase
MDDRGYVAQALFDRLRAEEIEFAILGDTRGFPDNAATEIEIAVPRARLATMPQAVARFCTDIDLQLVQLLDHGARGWQFVLAWSDDVGRPRFLGLRALSDYYRGACRLLSAEELLAATPEVQFIHGLVQGLDRQALPDDWLSHLWHADPRAAIERIARCWRKPADIRLIAQAARHGDWRAVRTQAPRLRRAQRAGGPPTLRGLYSVAAGVVQRAFRPAGAVIAFVGPEPARGALREKVERDLAPAFPTGMASVEHSYREEHWGVDFGVVLEGRDGAEASEAQFDDVIRVDAAQRLPAMAVAVERALLRWLENRVERRYPEAVVGSNAAMARLLQFACRTKLPFLRRPLEVLLNCSLACRIDSPILMPYPYGIVIERNAVIGSRVTVMHQVTIGARLPGESDMPVIEDKVSIGAGAKILGRVRIGRGARVGANAVVTRDVPSHCTVVGINRIVGAEGGVVEKRQRGAEPVVNT